MFLFLVSPIGEVKASTWVAVDNIDNVEIWNATLAQDNWSNQESACSALGGRQITITEWDLLYVDSTPITHFLGENYWTSEWDSGINYFRYHYAVGTEASVDGAGLHYGACARDVSPEIHVASNITGVTSILSIMITSYLPSLLLLMAVLVIAKTAYGWVKRALHGR